MNPDVAVVLVAILAACTAILVAVLTTDMRQRRQQERDRIRHGPDTYRQIRAEVEKHHDTARRILKDKP